MIIVAPPDFFASLLLRWNSAYHVVITFPIFVIATVTITIRHLTTRTPPSAAAPHTTLRAPLQLLCPLLFDLEIP